MKDAWISEERNRLVQEAARAWHGAGAIDAAALETVAEVYPCRRQHLSPLLKGLAVFFVSMAVLAFVGASGMMLFAGSGIRPALGFFYLVIAGGLAFSADWLRGASHTLAAGADATVAFWSAAVFVAGFVILFSIDSNRVMLIVAGLAFAAAACRWGFALTAVLGAAFLFLFAGCFEPGRAFWLAGGIPVAILAGLGLDREDIAAAYRRCLAGVMAVGLAAAYAAMNTYSLDERLIEELSGSRYSSGTPHPASFLLAALATALLPAAVLAWGLLTRRKLLLLLGIGFTVLSLLTLRAYVHVAALWVVLLAAGGVLIFLSAGLNRFLTRAPGGERFGYTAAPLFEAEEQQRLIQAAAFAAGYSSPAAKPSEAEPAGFTGHGGGFDGGGATGKV